MNPGVPRQPGGPLLTALILSWAVVAHGGTEPRSRLVLFPPETFHRTPKGPQTFTRGFAAPSTEGRFFLTVANGDGFGNRLSSGTITLNGSPVFVPSDFNQTVVRLRREVAVLTENELVVHFTSNPGGFWTIDVEGEIPETALPAELRDRAGTGVFFRRAFLGTDPAATETAGFTVPLTAGRFDLAVANGEGSERVTAARVHVNGVQVLRPQDFNETVDALLVPIVVADANVLDVAIQSGAGHRFTLTVKGFVPDATAPELTIASPAGGECTGANDVIRIVYSDAITGVDPTTFRAFLNGVDVASLMTVGDQEATVRLGDLEPLLPQARDVFVEVQVSDHAANLASAQVRFTYDSVPPGLAILEPPEGTVTGDSTPDVVVSWEDSISGVEPATARILMNGVDVTAAFAVAGSGASLAPNTSVSRPDGPELRIEARVADCSGNEGIAARTVFVDTVAPRVQIHAPSVERTSDPAPEVVIEYHDEPPGPASSGIDVASLRVLVDGVDRTSLFLAGSALAGLAEAGTLFLADGTHTLSATVRDRALNTSPEASRTFLVDTLAPTLSMEQPADGLVTNERTPAVLLRFGDGGSGIDTGSLSLAVHGTDATGKLAQSTGEARLAPDARLDLPDGVHIFAATVQDRSGNLSRVSAELRVDTRPPTAFLVDPPPGVVSGISSPEVRVRLEDEASGVDLASVRLVVGGVDRTGAFQVLPLPGGDAEALHVAGSALALADGPVALEVRLRDRALNEATVPLSFMVDTRPPALVLEPGEGAVLGRHPPTFAVEFLDDTSGVEPSSVHIVVDGVDRTGLFLIDERGAHLPASRGFVLSDGAHQWSASARDAAGHEASAFARFTVDSIAPGLTILSPQEGGLLATATPTIELGFDGGTSGLDTGSLRLRVDGIDRTAVLALTATGAAGSLPTSGALAEGAHTLEATIRDGAGNEAHATAGFVVDTLAPAVSITPASGAVVNLSRPSILALLSDPGGGTGIEAPSVLVLLDGVDATVAATVSETAASLTPGVDLLDGVHTVSVEVSDRAGNRTLASATFTVAARGIAAVRLVLPSTVTAGTLGDLTVAALNAAGEVATAFDGVVLLGVPEDPLSLVHNLPVPFAPEDAGLVTVRGLAFFTRAGARRVEARALAPDSATGSATLTVRPAPPNRLERLAGAADETIVLGTAPARALVRVADVFGNAIAGVTVEASLAGTRHMDTDTAGQASFDFPALSSVGSFPGRIAVPDSALGPLTWTVRVSDLPLLDYPLTEGQVATPTPTVAGRAPPGRSVSVFVDGVPVGSVTAAPDGRFSFTGGPLAEGDHTLEVVVTDPVSGTRSSGPVGFRVDLSRPGTPGVAGPAPEALLLDPVTPFTGQAEPLATVRLIEEARFVGTALVSSAGTFTATPDEPWAPGKHRVQLEAADRAGNLSVRTRPFVFFVGANPVSGVVLDARAGFSRPARGVSVSLPGLGLAAETDSAGHFFLPSVPPGEHSLAVDGSSLGLARIHLPVTVHAAQVNLLAAPVVLVPHSTAHAVPIALDGGGRTTAAMTVQSPAASGVVLGIAAGARVSFPAGAEPAISITTFDPSHLPPGLPAAGMAPVAYELGPTGTGLPDGAALAFPNTARLPPGASRPVYHFHAGRGGWERLGEAIASADGRSLELAGRPLTSLSAVIVGSGNDVPGSASGTLSVPPGGTDVDIQVVALGAMATLPRTGGSYTLSFSSIDGFPITIGVYTIVQGMPVFVRTSYVFQAASPHTTGHDFDLSLRTQANLGTAGLVHSGTGGNTSHLSASLGESLVGAVGELQAGVLAQTYAGSPGETTIAEPNRVAYVTDGRLAISGTVTSATAVEVFDGTTRLAVSGGQTQGVVTTDPQGVRVYRVTLDAALPDGVHEIRAVGHNPDNAPSEPVFVIVDSIAPPAPTLAPLPGGVLRPDGIAITGTGSQPGNRIEVYAQANQIRTLVGLSAVSPTTNAYSLTTTGAFPAGTVTVVAQEVDVAGNRSVDSASRTVTTDLPPTARVTQVTGNAGDIDLSFTLADPRSDQATVRLEFSLDGGAFTPATASTVGPFATSPGGTAHTLRWPSRQDLPAVNADRVVLRITPDQTADTFLNPGVAGDGAPFALRNNTPPALANLRFDPTVVRHANALTVLYDDTDLDGDRVDVAFRWERSANAGTSFAVIATAATATLPAGTLNRGDLVRVTLTPSDGKDRGPTLTSPT
ncbi:MAG: Ig-like domain repeat protein, partial [Planctomycetes bacterium]|nr:Ig-like domain repeat protein [Planctomycetota bacterium]